MTGAELLRIADELDAYYREFDDCVARSEGHKWLRVYARGQLGPLERKSLEPIADAEGWRHARCNGFSGATAGTRIGCWRCINAGWPRN